MENHIIVLTEAWTCKDSKVDLDGYSCLYLYRNIRHRNVRRNSGGIVIYCKDDVSKGISLVKNEHSSLIWLKFDKYFFNIADDIYFCAVYVWPENSPLNRLLDCDLYEILQNNINEFEAKGKVIIAGDFNARTASKTVFISCDNVFDTDQDDYVPDTPLPRYLQRQGE